MKREKDITHFSRTIRSVMHGFVTLEEAGFFGTMVDADESYSYMVKTLIRSLTLFWRVGKRENK